MGEGEIEKLKKQLGDNKDKDLHITNLLEELEALKDEITQSSEIKKNYEAELLRIQKEKDSKADIEKEDLEAAMKKIKEDNSQLQIKLEEMITDGEID